ncbi:uncharacterized protein PG986_009856 [Apiospora aurea]|uniref:Uncharacterized protein n=1 Tax=Apiospora aurea TaxID=335848 RepID=A0ABR1Q938_9PEZI
MERMMGTANNNIALSGLGASTREDHWYVYRFGERVEPGVLEKHWKRKQRNATQRNETPVDLQIEFSLIGSQSASGSIAQSRPVIRRARVTLISRKTGDVRSGSAAWSGLIDLRHVQPASLDSFSQHITALRALTLARPDANLGLTALPFD